MTAPTSTDARAAGEEPPGGEGGLRGVRAGRTGSRRRRWPFVVIAVVLVVILSAVITAAVIVKRAPTVGALADAKPGEWSSVPLPAPALNGDGSPYNIFVKPGSGPNLMIFFGDGGISWNAETTLEPISPSSLLFGGGGNFYYDNVPFYAVNTFGGMLSADAQNPFADFTTVYVPVTTGDLGLGNSSATLTGDSGVTAKAPFNGANNTRAALDWVYANVRAPGKVLVAGSGTSGLTSAFWLQDVAEHYATQQLFEYSDSSYIEALAFDFVVDPVWRGRFEARFGYALGRDPLRAAVTANAQAYGSRLTTLISNTLLDRTLAGYSAGLDQGYYSAQAGADWNYGLKASLRALTDTSPLDPASPESNASAAERSPTVPPPSNSPPAFVFVTDFGADEHGETPHILSTGDTFTTATQDGVTLSRWLTDAVIDDAPRSVGLDQLKK